MKHVLVLALSCCALSSCVSHPAMRNALEERDTEIRELRKERTQLRQQIQLLNYDKEKLGTALTDASMQLEAPRANERSRLDANFDLLMGSLSV